MNDSLQNQPTGRALDAPFYVSLGAAFGAILAAGFAYWQATITKDVEWRSLRSYVGVTSPTIHFVENDSVSGKVLLQVFGQTPAYDVAAIYYLSGGGQEPRSLEVLEKATDVQRAQVYKKSIFPSQSPAKYTPLPVENIKWKPDKDMIDHVNSLSGGARLYIQRTVSYDDIFRCKHLVTFCFDFYGNIVLDGKQGEECDSRFNNSDDTGACSL